MRSRVSVVLTMLAVVGSTFVVGSRASADEPCTGPGTGGEWTAFGRDVTGSRHQTEETAIGAAEAASLGVAWTFTPADGGVFNATPVVANGCVFIGSSLGLLHAVDAASGEVVWERQIDFAQPGLGGAFVSSVAVADGKVFAHISETGAPHVMALDAATGETLWTSDALEDDPRARIDAGVVYSDGRLFVALTGGDAQPDRTVPFAILDAETGDVLKLTPIITDEELAQGYAGGGIWATAVVDEAEGYAFAGNANPYSKRKEHRYANAILKIDIDPSRPTFGEIVDAYKGEVDQYFPGLDRQPLCQTFGDNPIFHYPVPGEQGFSLACLQLDIDFGASPNLFVDSEGRTLIGELQKSGVYHVVYADNMQRAWTAVVSYPSAAGNSATTAVDDAHVYASGLPGVLYALDKDTGGYSWIAPIAGGGLYQALSVANGVVYGLTAAGTLNAYDAATGIPLASRQLAADTGHAMTSFSSSGVSIAGGTVFAAQNDTIVALRPS